MHLWGVCVRDSVQASVMCMLPSKYYYQHDTHAAVCYRAHFSAGLSV